MKTILNPMQLRIKKRSNEEGKVFDLFKKATQLSAHSKEIIEHIISKENTDTKMYFSVESILTYSLHERKKIMMGIVIPELNQKIFNYENKMYGWLEDMKYSVATNTFECTATKGSVLLYDNFKKKRNSYNLSPFLELKGKKRTFLNTILKKYVAERNKKKVLYDYSRTELEKAINSRFIFKDIEKNIVKPVQKHLREKGAPVLIENVNIDKNRVRFSLRKNEFSFIEYVNSL